jgi:hypothetical protein
MRKRAKYYFNFVKMSEETLHRNSCASVRCSVRNMNRRLVEKSMEQACGVIEATFRRSVSIFSRGNRDDCRPVEATKFSGHPLSRSIRRPAIDDRAIAAGKRSFCIPNTTKSLSCYFAAATMLLCKWFTVVFA